MYTGAKQEGCKWLLIKHIIYNRALVKNTAQTIKDENALSMTISGILLKKRTSIN